MSDADSDVRDLLKDAFEAARTSGRSTWWEMTAAVLKNRLLQLARGSFDESQFGAGRFLDLLGGMTISSRSTGRAVRPSSASRGLHRHRKRRRGTTGVLA